MCPAPALGRMGRALSGRVAASDELREPEQQRDALRFFASPR